MINDADLINNTFAIIVQYLTVYSESSKQSGPNFVVSAIISMGYGDSPLAGVFAEILEHGNK